MSLDALALSFNRRESKGVVRPRPRTEDRQVNVKLRKCGRLSQETGSQETGKAMGLPLTCPSSIACQRPWPDERKWALDGELQVATFKGSRCRPLRHFSRLRARNEAEPLAWPERPQLLPNLAIRPDNDLHYSLRLSCDLKSLASVIPRSAALAFCPRASHPASSRGRPPRQPSSAQARASLPAEEGLHLLQQHDKSFACTCRHRPP